MASKNVLVVDDDPASLFAFTAILEQEGYKVTSSSSCEAAIAVRPVSIDAAVIDLRLPDKPGTELGAQLRTANPKVNIIYVTAYGPEGLEKMRGEVVLVKPIDMQKSLRLL